MIDRRALALMRPDAILINCLPRPGRRRGGRRRGARRGQALGLRRRRLRGRAVPAGHPLIGRDDVIFTPHSAAQTVEGLTNMASASPRKCSASFVAIVPRTRSTIPRSSRPAVDDSDCRRSIGHDPQGSGAAQHHDRIARPPFRRFSGDVSVGIETSKRAPSASPYQIFADLPSFARFVAHRLLVTRDEFRDLSLRNSADCPRHRKAKAHHGPGHGVVTASRVANPRLRRPKNRARLPAPEAFEGQSLA